MSGAASWWLFGLGLTAALATGNALWPAFRPALLSGLSFFASWFIKELAVHHMLAQAAVAASLVANGGLGGWPGQVGLGLFGASLLGLLWCQVQSARARVVLDDALEGAAPLATVRDRPGQVPDASLVWAWPLRPRSVEKIRDLVYRRVDGLELKLDIFRHRDRPTGCPVVLELHGGGWVIGNKREQDLPLMHHLAARGWLCASANYRLAPRARLPDMVADAKHALAWLRSQAGEYGGDPSFLATTGGSAGGHLAALLALTPDDPELAPGLEGADLGVQACVALYPVPDLIDAGGLANPGLVRLLERTVIGQPRSQADALYRRLSPLHRLGPQAPPFFVLGGTHDVMTPLAATQVFVDVFRQKCQAEIRFAQLPAAQHAFAIFHSVRANAAVEAITRFLEHQVAHRS